MSSTLEDPPQEAIDWAALMNQMAAGTLIAQLGIEITEATRGRVVGTMPVDERTIQPFGVLHGGASVALAETLGSYGGAFLVGESGGRIAGLEVNANHLRPVQKGGQVRGEARIVHQGKRTQVWTIEIHDQQEQLVCLARLTLAVSTP